MFTFGTTFTFSGVKCEYCKRLIKYPQTKYYWIFKSYDVYLSARNWRLIQKSNNSPGCLLFLNLIIFFLKKKIVGVIPP